jgi:hypothetical protein
MLLLALLLAGASAGTGAAPHPAPPVRAEATATVRIVRPAIISAATRSSSPATWRETDVRLPDGTIEQVRVVDLP